MRGGFHGLRHAPGSSRRTPFQFIFNFGPGGHAMKSEDRRSAQGQEIAQFSEADVPPHHELLMSSYPAPHRHVAEVQHRPFFVMVCPTGNTGMPCRLIAPNPGAGLSDTEGVALLSSNALSASSRLHDALAVFRILPYT